MRTRHRSEGRAECGDNDPAKLGLGLERPGGQALDRGGPWAACFGRPGVPIQCLTDRGDPTLPAQWCRGEGSAATANPGPPAARRGWGVGQRPTVLGLGLERRART